MENRRRPTCGPAASESLQFAIIRQACQNNDPHAALTSLIIWFGICQNAQRASSIENFAGDSDEHPLAEQIKILREARLSNSKKWSGVALLGALVYTRGKLLSHQSGS